MMIQNSTTKDIDTIYALYKMASDFQKTKKTVVVWPDFEPELINTEIKDNKQFKLVINGVVACVWAVAYKDLQIWENSNNDKALYIHRIATHTNFRGQDMVSKIVDWAKGFAKNKDLDYVRLDTLGNNTRLIAHYTNAGFEFLGLFKLNNTEGLPSHYHNQPACLFQIKL